jgi:DNA-binding Lrp family transcriptional regulator
MRTFQADAITQKILNLASRTPGISFYSLRVALSLNHSVLSHRLKRLLQRGIISNLGGFYLLTPEGLALKGQMDANPQMVKASPKRHWTASKASPNPSILAPKRHWVALYYPLKENIPSSDIRMILQQQRIAYQEDGLNQFHFTYTLTTELHSSYIKLYTPDMWYEPGIPAAEMEAKAKTLLDREAYRLVSKLSETYPVKLRELTLGQPISYYSKEEIAHEDHPISQATEEHKVVLCHNPEDHKERAVIDSSKLKTRGFKEMELVHRESAGEDSDVVDREFKDVEAKEQDWNDLLDGKIRLGALRDLPLLKETTALLVDKQVYETQFFSKHNALIDEDRASQAAVRETMQEFRDSQATVRETMQEFREVMRAFTLMIKAERKGFWDRIFKRW